jgi:hypothetical protein
MSTSDSNAKDDETLVTVKVVETTKTTIRKKIKLDWEKTKKSTHNVGFWLGFCVIIALTPPLSSWLVLGAVRQPFDMQKTFGHGELLAISIAIMGEAMGYLLTNPKVSSSFKSIVGLGCTLTLLACAFLLGVLTISNLNFDSSYITKVSIFLFGITLIVGSFCKWTER